MLLNPYNTISASVTAKGGMLALMSLGVEPRT